MGDKYPNWPSFRNVQRPDLIVGAAISGMLNDLGINQIPQFRGTEIPVTTIPRPKIGEQRADSVGFSDSRGQVKSSLFALVMAPMGAKEIADQTRNQKADESEDE